MTRTSRSQKSLEVRAADELEYLLPVIREMVNQIRSGEETEPYAAVFLLRRHIGRIVKSLGLNTPAPSLMRRLACKYRAQVQDDETRLHNTLGAFLERFNPEDDFPPTGSTASQEKEGSTVK